MRVIISEDFLIEDRQQFQNLITKRKNKGIRATDADIANIEELSISDGYLVLFAKLYFNEIDHNRDGYVAKKRLEYLSNILRNHSGVIKVLQKPLFQYNDLDLLYSDIKAGLELLAAKTFYKKIPSSLKSPDDFKHYSKLMANAEMRIKAYGVENIIFKKVSKFNNIYDFLLFIDKIIDGTSDFEDVMAKYINNSNVKLIFKNEDEQALLYVAKNEQGFNALTENTVWCISEDYGSEHIQYRNEYSKNGSLTFFRMYNFLSADEDQNSVGFFHNGNVVSSAFDLADNANTQLVDNFLNSFNIDLSKEAIYEYEFYDESENYDEDYDEDYSGDSDDDENSDNESDALALLRFKHLAEIFDECFNTSFTFNYNTSLLTDTGREFVEILNANVNGEGDSTNGNVYDYLHEYIQLVKGYFPNKNKVSTKQIVNFFETYYEGFKFNYKHTGQDLFGDISTTTVKEPLKMFMDNLSEVGIPIDLNESKILHNKVIILESTFLKLNFQKGG